MDDALQACRDGDLSSLRHILSHNRLDVNMQDKEGKTLAMVAAENGNKNIADYLSICCDVDVVDSRNRGILHAATIGGNVNLVKDILSQKEVGVNSVDSEGKSPVMIAAIKGHAEMFDYLVNNGGDLSLTDVHGNTLLHCACYGRNRKIMGKIIAKKPNINVKNNLGLTPLMLAAMRGYPDVFDHLLKQGSNLTLVDNEGSSVLHLAAESGESHIVDHILYTDKSALNSKDSFQRTPVMVAAYKGYKSVFFILVTQECDVGGTASDNNTLLHYACMGGCVEAVEFLIKRQDVGVDRPGHGGRAPAMFAARHGHLRAFEVLALQHCDLTTVDHKGNAVIHHAALGGNVDIVNFLLAHDLADVNGTGTRGMTPVMMAAMQGHNVVFEFLINKGCHMFPTSTSDLNVLHIACLSNNVKAVDYILTHDLLPVTTRGRLQRTPMMMAAGKGHKDIFDLFVEKGCDFSLTDELGLNMLHIASIGGNVGIIEYIVSLKLFDIDCKSGDFGRTPLMIAAERDKKAAFQLLLREGADIRVEDSFGNNVLHSACVGGGVEIVESILDQDVLDINSMSKHKDSPLLLAHFNNHEKLVALLESKGCKEESCAIS